MTWIDVLTFARGPLFQASILVFIAGMIYRLVRVIFLGWSPDRVKNKGSKAGGVVMAYLKSILIWPFIPWVKNTFKKNPLIYIAGGLFHLGLFVVLVLGTAHMLVWKSLLGFGWKTLPLPFVDWMAAVTICAMVVLFINRIINPVLKLISGPAEWLNLLFVFLPMITGYALTHHLFFRYEVLFSIHMLCVDFLLIWIPFSRISHFIFYFFSKTIHGEEFGKRGVKA
jgi:nitrate reductase gamma subunit